MCISDYMQTTFFNRGRFLKKLADDQCFSITKGSIYYIKHMYIQPNLFTTVVDWPEIWRWMEVSTMFHVFRYCVFTWYGRHNVTTYFERQTCEWKKYTTFLFVKLLLNMLSGLCSRSIFSSPGKACQNLPNREWNVHSIHSS